MKKMAIALVAFASFSVLSACNTIEGVGKDVGAAGDTVAKTAKDVKEDIKD